MNPTDLAILRDLVVRTGAVVGRLHALSQVPPIGDAADVSDAVRTLEQSLGALTFEIQQRECVSWGERLARPRYEPTPRLVSAADVIPIAPRYVGDMLTTKACQSCGAGYEVTRGGPAAKSSRCHACQLAYERFTSRQRSREARHGR
jgi:hypothetical protein